MVILRKLKIFLQSLFSKFWKDFNIKPEGLTCKNKHANRGKALKAKNYFNFYSD